MNSGTQVEAWLAAALADAERRGLPELKPLLESLADAMRVLRASERLPSPLVPPASGPQDADRKDGPR